MSFDVEGFRKKFPQLERKMGPNPLVYFDNGASTLKHSDVTDRVNSYNRFESSNVHRGAHLVSRQGTEAYEVARKKIATFINAREPNEIIFNRGTTEGINLVASILESKVKAGDEILISSFEHHSNVVPWQVLCEKKGATLKVVPFHKEKGFAFEAFDKALTEKTKIVSMLYYSNSLGNRLPVEKIVENCKRAQAYSVIDAAQVLLTERVDVQNLDCDFLCFSGHKMYGPYGTGVIYGKKALLEELPPYQTGGSMIDRVSFEKTTYADIPQKFEAGTPNVAGALGLGVAANLIRSMDFKEVHQHVLNLRKQLKEGLREFESVEIYDFPAEDYAGTLSFNMKGTHPSDVGTLLDKYGFAVRAGHHCTQPLMDLLGVPGTVRVSFAPFNTDYEIESFFVALKKVEGYF